MWDFLVLFLKIIRYKALNPAIIMAIKKAISILINGKNKPAQNINSISPKPKESLTQYIIMSIKPDTENIDKSISL